jgi:hypothetical protein
MVKNFAQGWLAIFAIAAATFFLYSIHLERLADADELYHILAAQGLLETGEPSIGEDGRYWRAYPLTWLVAQSFALFGASLTTARLPSVVFMTALVVALFVFLRREANPLAAWLGAGLFAVSPFAIAMAQFTRFYSLQGLVFFIAAWLLYLQVGRPWSLRRLAGTVVAVIPLLSFAAYLQPTTLLGIAGLGLWVVMAVLLPWLFDPDVPARLKRLAVAGLLLAGIAAIGAFWAIGMLDPLWQRYRTTMVFNELQGDNFLFYHIWYMLYYPTLWTLAGIISVAALIDRPRLTGFALTIFLTGFVLNSFAGAKSLRYIFYAQPFLFILWGVGLAAMLRAGHGLFGRLRDQLEPIFAQLVRRPARGLASAFLGLALLSVVVVNPAWLRSVTMLADVAIPPQPPREDWRTVEPVLRPWLDRVEVLVTTEELGALYYLGRADILLSASKFVEIPVEDQRPFAPDPRSDVPVIADAQGLAVAIGCHASGLFITKTKWWGDSTFGPEATMRDVAVEELIEARAEPLDLPPRSGFLAFAWDHGEPFERPAACRDLPTIAAGG